MVNLQSMLVQSHQAPARQALHSARQVLHRVQAPAHSLLNRPTVCTFQLFYLLFILHLDFQLYWWKAVRFLLIVGGLVGGNSFAQQLFAVFMLGAALNFCESTQCKHNFQVACVLAASTAGILQAIHAYQIDWVNEKIKSLEQVSG